MTTRLRASALAARDELAAGRDQVRVQHQRGLDGVQVCRRLTSLVDAAIVKLYEAVMADLPAAEGESLRGRTALVAHGGYGRRHLAPFSDVDLMILHEGRADDAVVAFSRRITQDVFDVGLQMGQSVRTPVQATQMARQDPLVGTSLLESRLLIGCTPLYERYLEGFAKMVERRRSALCRAFIEARREERRQYGETVYLLEPNIKRSRGGLRDLHLLRWLWYTKSGEAEPDRLHGMGIISKFDYRRLVSARSLLLKLRNDMHFHANAACDALTRTEQIRLAERFGYLGTPGLHPAEQFMRDYFHHTNHIWTLAHRIAELIQPTSTVTRVMDPMFGRSIEADYRIGIREISSTGLGQGKLKTHLEEVLRLVDLARSYDKWISQETWYLIYRAAPDYSSDLPPATVERFLDIMANPLKLGELLRRLHELGVLEKILPDFTHARCLMQFNQYHKYTVDEHCILAVEEVTEFSDRKDTLGEVYRNLRGKRLLHLALLLHDLGKGHEEDHSEIGKRIAERTARRLALSAEETETLVFLVHKHLRMSHLAFRRDTSRTDLVERFAAEVGRGSERLEMLYLLSCADLAAVGPGVLNNWKVEVLTDLYHRAMRALAPGGASLPADRRSELRTSVWRLLSKEEQTDDWFDRQFAALPESWVAGGNAEKIASTLKRLRHLPAGKGRAWGTYEPQTDTVEFVTGVDHGSGRGIFSSMAGVLSSRRIEILAAETVTLADGLLLQRYIVHDVDSSGQPSAERLDEISASLIDAIDSEEPPTFHSVWGRDQVEADAALTNLPQEVRIDNQLSEDCTIVEVFTVDRRGLLYALARALHNLRLIIKFAKIGTYLDQVVDVFYVTESDGTKPHSEERLEAIRNAMEAIISPQCEN